MIKRIGIKIAAFLCVSAVFFSYVFVSGGVAFALTADEIPHGISVTFNGDVYSQRGIAWVAGKQVTDCRVEVIEKGDFGKEEIDWSASGVVRFAGRTDLIYGERIREQYTGYKALVTGLTENTDYYFRIYSPSQDVASEVGEFRIGDSSAEYLNFINFTDPQASSKGSYQKVAKVLESAIAVQPDCAFLLCGGDNVNNSRSMPINLDEWNYYFDECSDVFLNYPLVTTAGNHESRDYAMTDRFYNDFQGAVSNMFSGGYFSFDYADAHFAVMNSNDSTIQSAQITWLKNDLAATQKTWKFVLIHWAPVTVGRYLDDGLTVKLRELLMPIMAEFEVDILFSGHNHMYMRTDPYAWSGRNGEVPINNPTIVTEFVDGVSTDFLVEPQGTTYVIANMSGNKQYEVIDVNNAQVAVNPVNGELAASGFNADNNSGDYTGENPTFVTVNIDFTTNRLVYKTYIYNRDTEVSVLYDVFGMYKDTHKPVERLVEKLPLAEEFTLDDTLFLKQAADAYEYLTPVAKQKINEANRIRLFDLLELVDIEGNFRALNAEEKICLIGEVALSAEVRHRIFNAEVAYGELTYAQKQQVRNYYILAEANDTLLNMIYAQGIIDFIEEISQEDENFSFKVSSARTAYNRLTAEQKNYVSNISQLVEYENLIKNAEKVAGCGAILGSDLIIISFVLPFGTALILLIKRCALVKGKRQ